jgi:hypothetical protein
MNKLKKNNKKNKQNQQEYFIDLSRIKDKIKYRKKGKMEIKYPNLY